MHYWVQQAIIIKPGPEIDPAEGPGLGFYGSTRVNLDQPGNSLIFLSF